MQNARLAERAPFLGQVDLVSHGSNRALRLWGHDVSEAGMFLQTTQPFAVGDTVSLRFDVDDEEVHVRAAEVVWVRRFEPISVDGKLPGVGLRFVSLDPSARAALRRLTRARGGDTLVDEGDTPVLPEPRLPLPPLTDSIVRKTSRDLDDTQDLVPPSVAPQCDGPAISLMPFSQPPLAISMPPENDNLAAEARVFDGIAATPRAVTLGPRPRSTPPAHPSTPAMGSSFLRSTLPLFSIDVAEEEPDPFAGWTFRRADPMPEAPQEETPAALTQRFDDDDPAPRARRNETIVEPSILESVSVPPTDAGDDGYSLGALPAGTERAFREGELAVRHLPLAHERRAAPHTEPRPRRSLGAAIAFLVAGCAAGAVVGVVQKRVQTAPVAAAAVAPSEPPPPAPVPAPPATPKDVAEAEAELFARRSPIAPAARQSPDSDVAAATKNAAPPSPPPSRPAEKAEKKAEMAEKAEKATLAQARKPATKEPLTAAPGRLEIDLPRGGAVKRTFTLAHPARVVVDLQDSALPKKGIDVDEGGALELRFGSPAVGTQRVVVVLAGDDQPDAADARLDGDRLIVTWRW